MWERALTQRREISEWRYTVNTNYKTFVTGISNDISHEGCRQNLD